MPLSCIKKFFKSHFVFGRKNHVSFLQSLAFRFAVLTYYANVDSITTSVDIASRERRFLSRIHIAKSIYADVRSDSPATPAEMQYLASDITACMAVASDLRSFRHWNILWKLMLDMLLGSIPDVSLTRLIFFFCTLPPLCFLIKYKWWYWRLQHHIVSRI